MPPLAPLLHSQHRRDIHIDQETGKVCIAILFFVVVIVIAITLTYCSRKSHRRIQKGRLVEHIPPGTRLFTLDGREIIIV